jgi:hypothetical protein
MLHAWAVRGLRPCVALEESEAARSSESASESTSRAYRVRAWASSARSLRFRSQSRSVAEQWAVLQGEDRLVLAVASERAGVRSCRCYRAPSSSG